MSSAVPFSAFSGLVASIQEGMREYLPESSGKGRVLAESSALVQVSYASLKNVSYVFLEKFSLTKMLSSRVTFFEAGLMCLVSTITNLVSAIFYTVFTVLTLGLSSNLRTRCKIHWMHVMYGFISMGISTCGVVMPYYGIGLNGMFLISRIKTFQQYYETDISRKESKLVKYVQDMASKHSYVIYNFFRSREKDWDYNNIVEPSLNHIKDRIISAERMKDLTNLAWDIFRKWPKMESLKYSNKEDKQSTLGSPAAHDHYKKHV
ncbi:MAG: hypothetical protein K1000chlam3_00208 [Chlamydiae bacterium]|nr:hypothetical protein [Chlamydiota bacterium]